MIPAKEKAEELINKSLRILFGIKKFYKKSDYFKAKQCAILCVDEILKTLSPYLGDNNARTYWQEVKTYLEQS